MVSEDIKVNTDAIGCNPICSASYQVDEICACVLIWMHLQRNPTFHS